MGGSRSPWRTAAPPRTAAVTLVLDGLDFEATSYELAAGQVLQVHEGLRVPDCALDQARSHRVGP